MQDIRKHITSEDVSVLEQSLRFVIQRATKEAERGKAAEARATAMLAILGILAGFIVPSVESTATIDGSERWALLTVFLTVLAFLVKGLFNAIRVLSVSRQYRVDAETVYDFQTMSHAQALQEEIACVLWEHAKAIRPNSEKLFWLQRSQRAAGIAVIWFMVFGVALYLANEELVLLPPFVSISIATLGVLAFFTVDLIAERYGGLWVRE